MNLIKLVVQIAFTVTIIFAAVGARSAVVKSSTRGETEKTATGATTTRRGLENQDDNAEIKSVSQKLLASQDDLREYISKQVNHVYEILAELAKSNDSQKILSKDVDQLVNFADQFFVGEFNKTFKLAEMSYTDVRVYGMADFKNYSISVDEKFRKARITLVANQLKIEGNYSITNFLKHDSGSFEVKLLDNVTYTEDDSYSKFNKNEIDIVTGEATIMYAKSEFDYRNSSVISPFFEAVVSNKLTEEILYRVGKELGHRIRPFIYSKIKKTSSLGRYNRISSIVQSTFSQIRTWLNATVTIKAPLPGVYHKLKVYNNVIPISEVTLTGLSTMYLSEEIKAYREKNAFKVALRGQAGPVIINGKTVVTEARNETLVQIPLSFAYEISDVRARIVVSVNSLRNEEDSLRVAHSDVSISRPSLRIQPAKIDFKRDELEQLAEFLKPGVETELHKWLKDFLNDIFRRVKSRDSFSSG